MPTQLNGRTIVYGSPYWSHAARAKYSTASFWNPYDESGGGISRSWPSYDGHVVGRLEHHRRAHVRDLLQPPGAGARRSRRRTTAAMMRSFVASRS